MKVVIVSHSSVVGMYQDRIRELAKFGDVTVTLIIPKVFHEGGKLVEGYEGDGTYTVIKLPAFMSKSGRQNGHFYRGIRGVLQTLAPDIIHLEEEPESLVTYQIIRIAQSLARRPKLALSSFRNQAMNFNELWNGLHFQHYLYPRLATFSLKNIDCLVSGTAEGCQVFRSEGYGGAMTEIPWLGVNPAVYSKKSPPNSLHERLQLSGTTIGYIGRLLHMKGIATLLDAASKIQGRYTLLLVGAGQDREEFVRQARRLGIAGNVRFIGGVPNESIVDYVQCMDLMVLPSRTTRLWKEQFGRVLTEAMACEVPVIGSSSGEIPTVIGDAGLIFPEGNDEALAECIASLIESPERRRSFGAAGRKRVLEHFSNAVVARKYHELYTELGVP